MSFKYIDENISTDNPFVDILMYNLKILLFNCIVKDEDAANKAETKESLNDSEIYMACMENTASLGIFPEIPEQFMRSVGMTDRDIQIYKNFGNDYMFIPEDDGTTTYRRDLLNLMRPYYIRNYEEKNEYYRKICGLPPLGDWGIPMRDYEYLLPSNFYYSGEFVHEIGASACAELESLGILDIIKADYPDAEYLNYITAGITIYDARKKLDFQLLFVPREGLDSMVVEEFETVYNSRREYLLKAVYSDAMGIESEYYHKVMTVYLLLMVMMDILSEVQSHIIKRDILDRRCIEYIFSMFGMPYYRAIPYKYQRRLCMNIHDLVKYKASATEMLNISKIFGFDNIEIFKYYILKVRKFDQWGDFLWSANQIHMFNENNVIKLDTTKEKLSEPSPPRPVPGNLNWYQNESSKVNPVYYDESGLTQIDDEDDTTSATEGALSGDELLQPTLPAGYIERYIPFPFEYFLEKGNVMLVRIDDYILKKGTDYVIYNYNKIRIKQSLITNHTYIIYDFYYNINTVEKTFDVDTAHALQMYTYLSTTHKSNVISIANTPFPKYFAEGQEVIVSIGSIWLSPGMYTINSAKETITINFDKRFVVGREVYVFCIYSSYLESKFEKHAVIATEKDQYRFYIPEPFPYYVLNENTFYVTVGSTYISPERYKINYSNVAGRCELEFTDGTKLQPGRPIVFNDLYSKNAIVNRIYMRRDTIELEATVRYQTEFEIDLPVTNYVGCGYKLYLKIHNTWLKETKYTYTNHSVIILDEALAINPGEKIEVLCIYCAKDRTQDKYSNVKVTRDYRIASKNRQKKFDVVLPVKHYNTKYNQVIVDIEGKYLVPNTDYTITYDGLEAKTATIKILDKNNRPMMMQKVNYTFVFNGDAEYVTALSTQEIPMAGTTANAKFSLEFPFFPYLQTGQDFLVIIGSTIVAKSRIHLIDQFTFYIDDYEPVNGRNITILYIYSNWYILNPPNKLIEEWKPVKIGTEDHVDIPEPGENYIANDWPYVVSYNNRKYLEETKYDVINARFYTYPPPDLLNKKYGDTITFIFIYLLQAPYVDTDIGEEYEKTMDLQFVKIPLSDIYSSMYLQDQTRWKNYDATVYRDGWWDGQYYKENSHELIKRDIYRSKFNYMRTKYYAVTQQINLSQFTRHIAYFYSMLYDDVYLEKELNVIVPSISQVHPCNIAHLFVYMTCLGYLYDGGEPIVLTSPVTALSAMGFNFKTDLEKLKQYILDNNRDLDMFDIWDFIKQENQITAFSDFMELYKNNYQVMDYITKSMVESQDYREYRIWKYLYDALMTWKFNYDYFKLGNGAQALTYPEFLQDKDNLLFIDYKNIEALSDPDARADKIISRVDDIVYTLEEFVEKKYSDIFLELPGRSANHVMTYMMMILNFFKSYKVHFLGRSQDLTITGGNDEDSTIRMYDLVRTRATSDHKEYYTMIPDVKTKAIDRVSDSYEMVEDVTIRDIRVN